MRIGKANISCGAFGQPSVLLLLSRRARRAHLLTTREANGVLPTADVRSARLCFGTSHRNGKFALAAKHRHFRFTTKNIKCCKEVIAYRHISS